MEANNVFFCTIFEQELTVIMAQLEAAASGVAVDPHEVILADLVSHAMDVVADDTTRFKITLAKPDALGDDDTPKVVRMVRDRTKIEETRLNGARARLAHASAYLFVISVARFGAARQPGIESNSKPRQLEPGEGGSKLLKRKLPGPKDGWKYAKSMTIIVYADKYRFFHFCQTYYGS